MLQWSRLFGWNKLRERDYGHLRRRLLPLLDSDDVISAFPAIEVTKVALKIKYQIEHVIPCELDAWKITRANSSVITRKVVQTCKEAGGNDYAACVIFCLLVCKNWFRILANNELWDADLHGVRAIACEVLAKQLIETEVREDFMMQESLLRRYSVMVNGIETSPTNVIEKAVDLHALRVIGSSGYQRCIAYLWKGWLIQNDADASQFVPFKDKSKPDYWTHFDPDRMRTPQYQNALQIFFSILYLVLYTLAINTINSTGSLDVVEAILYLMTAGFVLDEVGKIFKDESLETLLRSLKRLT